MFRIEIIHWIEYNNCILCEQLSKENIKDLPGLILKINIYNFSKIDLLEIQNRIKRLNPNHIGNIYLIHGDLNESQINELYNYNKVKAFISFTHGEGWGRDLAQFSVCNKPILTSNFSGHLDFLNQFISLNGELKQIHKSSSNNFSIIHFYFFSYMFKL